MVGTSLSYSRNKRKRGSVGASWAPGGAGEDCPGRHCQLHTTYRLGLYHHCGLCPSTSALLALGSITKYPNFYKHIPHFIQSQRPKNKARHQCLPTFTSTSKESKEIHPNVTILNSHYRTLFFSLSDIFQLFCHACYLRNHKANARFENKQKLRNIFASLPLGICYFSSAGSSVFSSWK